MGWVSLVLAGAAILLAALRTVPAAVRLGARTDSSRHQSELTESIGRDHVFCAAAIVAVVAIELSFACRPVSRACVTGATRQALPREGWRSL